MIELVAVFACLFVAGLVLVTVRDKDHWLDYMIGASAGLQGAQIMHVHVFVIIVVLATCLRPPRLTKYVGRIACFMAAVLMLDLSSVLGTFVNSKTLPIQILTLAVSGWLVALRATPSSVHRMLWGLYICCAFGSAVAVLQELRVVPYTPFVDASGVPRVKGIYHEPDWLGLFSGIGLILLFQFDLTSRKVVHLVCAPVLVAALLLSGARASWLALAITFAVLVSLRVVFPEDVRVLGSRNKPLLVGLVSVCALLVLDPAILHAVLDRINGANNQISVLARTEQRRALDYLASIAPWHGLGLSAAGHVTVSGQILYGRSPNNVASDWILGWWVDAKYLAVPMIAFLIVLTLVSLRSTAGLIMLAVLITSLFSNVVLNPILWFAVGLALSRVRAMDRVSARSGKPQSSGFSPSRQFARPHQTGARYYTCTDKARLNSVA